ncbi:uncharacterized protein LOC143890381 [Tasmannia lanceolata]|uniref:uncharacterized protein LOC143890381 n=1 Tax=Tasmannia lanceolata TaxID=3420 RepID=UPI0040631FDA
MKLFQGGEYMFSMDLKSTGITWVGNIYQKLETVCQEVCQDVESIMNQGEEQEPSKYVESQLQSVGVNVRRFCNEIMQDLLSSSACSVKGPVSDLSLIYDSDVGMCKRSKIGPEKCPVSEKPFSSAEWKAIVSDGKDLNPRLLDDASQDVNLEKLCDTPINKSIPISFAFPEIAVENQNNVSDIAASIVDLPSTLPSEPIVSHETKVLESELVLSSSGLSTNAIDTCTLHETLPHARSAGIGHEQHKKPTVLEESLPAPEIGRSDGSDLYEASEVNDANEPGTDIIEEFEHVNLEESCIQVEKNGPCLISHQASKNRSYKKKFRDAFTSKLQPVKKHDYEEIAIWYGDIDVERKRRVGISSSSSLIEDLESKNLSSLDPCESDWELL